MVAIALFAFGVISDRFGTGAVFVVAVGGVVVANLLSRTIRTGRLGGVTTPAAV
jgi:hypoxanthine phosphoribosyltransferase